MENVDDMMDDTNDSTVDFCLVIFWGFLFVKYDRFISPIYIYT